MGKVGKHDGGAEGGGRKITKRAIIELNSNLGQGVFLGVSEQGTDQVMLFYLWRYLIVKFEEKTHVLST